MEDMKQFYFDCKKELSHHFFQGDLEGFISLEKQLNQKDFFINKYEQITGFNLLHSLFAGSKNHTNLKENLELTQYIYSQTGFDPDIAAIFTLKYNLRKHVSFWFQEFGSLYLDKIFAMTNSPIHELDLQSLNDLLMSVANFDPLLNDLIKEFDIKEFTAVQNLKFLTSENYSGFKNMLGAIFNNPKNHVIKTIGQIIQKGNIAHLSFLHAVKTVCPEVSDDKLLNVPAQTGNFSSSRPYLHIIKDLLSHLSLERRFNFMVKALLDTRGNYEKLFDDTAEMYNFIKTKSIGNNIDFSDCKNFKDLHDAVSKHLTNIKQENEVLPSNWSHLDKKVINGYSIKIPSENNDLVHAGKHMNICVGSGIYLSRILMRKSDIILLCKNQNPEVCIELAPDGSTIQIKGHNNSEFKDEKTLNLLNQLLS